MQSKYGENALHLPNATPASILRSAVGGDQPLELLKRNPPVGNSKYGMGDQRQLSLASEDLKNPTTPPFNPRAAGSNLPVNTSHLNGWPLLGLDRLQPGLYHQKSSFSHPYQPSQLQLQQQIRALLTGQEIDMENIGMDSRWNLLDNDAPTIVQVQVGLPISSHGAVVGTTIANLLPGQPRVERLSILPRSGVSWSRTAVKKDKGA